MESESEIANSKNTSINYILNSNLTSKTYRVTEIGMLLLVHVYRCVYFGIGKRFAL